MTANSNFDIAAPLHFDTSVQFLHVHVYNILFKEPIETGNEQLVLLLETLLTYERSIEFRKLGL